jgi:hypothetical protein
MVGRGVGLPKGCLAFISRAATGSGVLPLPIRPCFVPISAMLMATYKQETGRTGGCLIVTGLSGVNSILPDLSPSSGGLSECMLHPDHSREEGEEPVRHPGFRLPESCLFGGERPGKR